MNRPTVYVSRWNQDALETEVLLHPDFIVMTSSALPVIAKLNLRDASALLIRRDNPSEPQMAEVLYAALHGIPVVIYGSSGRALPGVVPWMEEHASVVVSTRREAIAWLRQHLLGEEPQDPAPVTRAADVVSTSLNNGAMSVHGELRRDIL